jgi:hypothetical protein
MCIYYNTIEIKKKAVSTDDFRCCRFHKTNVNSFLIETISSVNKNGTDFLKTIKKPVRNTKGPPTFTPA